MVRLKILSGRQAGIPWASRGFPVRVGRSVDCDLRLEEPGVWNHHFQILLNPAAGFVLQTEPDALITVNGQSLQRTVLRNGDSIEIGAVKLQFWLAEAARWNPVWTECLVWSSIIAVSAAQIVLIYALSR
jgi:pSer/pThr/pTyr-binding forkhead associated (FHA) protein